MYISRDYAFLERPLEWAIRILHLLRLDKWLLGGESDENIARRFTTKTPLLGGLGGIIVAMNLDIVIKRPKTATAEERWSVRTMAQSREARLYRDPFFTTHGLMASCLPKIYSVWISPLDVDYHIAMERVNADTLKIHLGNQSNVFGNPPHKKFFQNMEKTADNLLKQLFQRAGEMHGLYWKDSSLLNIDWLKGIEWYSGKGAEAYEQSLNWCRGLHRSGVEFRPEGTISKSILDLLDRELASSSFANLESYIKTAPMTLHHGDFHAGNIMVCPKSGVEDDSARFVFLDWGNVGVFDPAFDLSQILISDLHGDRYDDLVYDLVTTWHARLCEVVLERWGYDVIEDGYTVAVAYKAVLKAGLRRWLFLLGALNGFKEVPDAAIKYFAYNLECWYRLFTKVVPQNEQSLGFLKV